MKSPVQQVRFNSWCVYKHRLCSATNHWHQTRQLSVTEHDKNLPDVKNWKQGIFLVFLWHICAFSQALPLLSQLCWDPARGAAMAQPLPILAAQDPGAPGQPSRQGLLLLMLSSARQKGKGEVTWSRQCCPGTGINWPEQNRKYKAVIFSPLNTVVWTTLQQVLFEQNLKQ